MSHAWGHVRPPGHDPISIQTEPRRSGRDPVAVVRPAGSRNPTNLGCSGFAMTWRLVPVEYPTTRRMGSTREDRAADLRAAFADPSIRAIITSIGDDDQTRVLPHLDRALLAANPKPFFSYGDTDLLVRSWNNSRLCSSDAPRPGPSTIRLEGDAKDAFQEDQRNAATQVFDEYGRETLIVFDVDFGHTHPQLVLPIKRPHPPRRAGPPDHRPPLSGSWQPQ